MYKGSVTLTEVNKEHDRHENNYYLFVTLQAKTEGERGESLVIYIMKNHHHKCVIDRLNLIPFPCMTTKPTY